MPEIPTTKIGFIKEGVKYLLRLPLIDFLADWGVKQITFTGGFTVKKEHLSMLDKNLDRLKKIKRRQRILFNQNLFFELLKSYYRDNTYINRRYKKGAYGISFMMNGVVGFCGSFLKLGNIRDRTPEEIWKSQEFTTARIEMIKCKKCLLKMKGTEG